MMETEDTYWTPLKMDEPVVGDYMATGENCYVPTAVSYTHLTLPTN